MLLKSIHIIQAVYFHNTYISKILKKDTRMPSGRQRLFLPILLCPKCLEQCLAYCIWQSHLLNVAAPNLQHILFCQLTTFFNFLSVWFIHLQLYIEVKEKTTGTLDLDGLAHRMEFPYQQILRMIENILRNFIQSPFQIESKVLVG